MEKRKEQQYRERIKQLRLFDDDFMTTVFDNNIECTQLILRIILERDDIVVKSVKTQSTKRVYPGHSVELDIDAVDQNDIPIDIEIQRFDKGAGAKRARYHSSVIDIYTLPKNTEYDNLKESYVIFLTESDFFGAGFPLYHIDRTVLEMNHQTFGDGSHIIYVNGAYKGNDEIGKLIHDFHSLESKNMNFEELAKQVRYYKETEEGVRDMCRVLEEMIDEEKRAIAEKLIMLDKLSEEEIAECSELPLETVRMIADEVTNE